MLNLEIRYVQHKRSFSQMREHFVHICPHTDFCLFQFQFAVTFFGRKWNVTDFTKWIENGQVKQSKIFACDKNVATAALKKCYERCNVVMCERFCASVCAWLQMNCMNCTCFDIPFDIRCKSSSAFLLFRFLPFVLICIRFHSFQEFEPCSGSF